MFYKYSILMIHNLFIFIVSTRAEQVFCALFFRNYVVAFSYSSVHVLWRRHEFTKNGHDIS